MCQNPCIIQNRSPNLLARQGKIKSPFRSSGYLPRSEGMAPACRPAKAGGAMVICSCDPLESTPAASGCEGTRHAMWDEGTFRVMQVPWDVTSQARRSAY